MKFDGIGMTSSYCAVRMLEVKRRHGSTWQVNKEAVDDTELRSEVMLFTSCSNAALIMTCVL